MNITTKKIVSSIFLMVIFAIPVFSGLEANADSFKSTRDITNTGLTSTSVYDIISTVMNWLLGIITFIAVIGFIISGIMFITAGGSGRAEDAKGWLTYSIIGIIVALIGYIIVNLVSGLLGGSGGVSY